MDYLSSVAGSINISSRKWLYVQTGYFRDKLLIAMYKTTCFNLRALEALDLKF